MLIKWPVPLLMLCLTGLQANGATMSTTSRPVVIELFTSQGCSSCPPAEALLGEYANDPGVLVLAFHVDYWDYLGWHDPFELPIAAQRQRGYAQSLRLQSTFTPQSIIDGRISLVGSDRRGLMPVLKQAHDGIPVTLNKNHNMLSIALPGLRTTQPLDINLVAYQSYASTPVGRGENAGHTLKEYNIVRAFQQLTSWDGHATRIDAPLDNIPAGADRIAILVQQPRQGQITGAASLPL